jgi:hypothetical protein
MKSSVVPYPVLRGDYGVRNGGSNDNIEETGAGPWRPVVEENVRSGKISQVETGRPGRGAQTGKMAEWMMAR